MSTLDFYWPFSSGVVVPSGATLDDFQEWVHSPSFPEKTRISYIQGQIYIEPTDEEIVAIPHSGMKLDDFRNWVYSKDFPKHGRITYIDGRIIIDMSPERIDSHNKVKSAINRTIDSLVQERNLGEYYPDGAWVTNDFAKLSSEPDAMFAFWETLRSGKLALKKRRPEDEDSIELIGTPDWVCEIISNSTEKYDKKDLLESYCKAGIREYWLIDARRDRVEFSLLVWTPDGYQPAEPRDGWHASQVFSREFQLIRFRNEVGRWNYELQQRTASPT
jgi:Uma2 family endonuclease